MYLIQKSAIHELDDLSNCTIIPYNLMLLAIQYIFSSSDICTPLLPPFDLKCIGSTKKFLYKMPYQYLYVL